MDRLVVDTTHTCPGVIGSLSAAQALLPDSVHPITKTIKMNAIKCNDEIERSQQVGGTNKDFLKSVNIKTDSLFLSLSRVFIPHPMLYRLCSTSVSVQGSRCLS